MPRLKYYNPTTEQWEYVVVGAQGAAGTNGTDGIDGDTGPSGVVAVTAPITNSGTSTSANIGIDQSALSIAASQINNLATGVETFLTTPTSANLAAAVTNETGTGNLVFSASPTFSGTVSGITKAMVGLANVDNTSDANKPVSNATNQELDKINIALSQQGSSIANLQGRTPFRMSAGTSTMTGNGTAAQSVAVTFPSGRFTEIPRTTISCRTADVLMATTASITTTGFTARLYHVNAATWSTLHRVDWIAIQMTSGNASG
jgi:hypothetical protein